MKRELKFRAYDLVKKEMYELKTLWLDIKYREEISIMQFTGLKDVNGIEIYDGDIIEYTQHHFSTNTLKTKRKAVEWKYDKWGVYETNAGESEIKVIGNIHENRELLTCTNKEKINN